MCLKSIIPLPFKKSHPNILHPPQFNNSSNLLSISFKDKNGNLSSQHFQKKIVRHNFCDRKSLKIVFNDGDHTLKVLTGNTLTKHNLKNLNRLTSFIALVNEFFY